MIGLFQLTHLCLTLNLWHLPPHGPLQSRSIAGSVSSDFITSANWNVVESFSSHDGSITLLEKNQSIK